ncbi:MAG: hypothetical protein H6736_10405 [Alphaproteobacteria bacterium]|nr:hypothetical protein [Alphaproteobacteria bacterium]MCB9692212.1 hypothetical protein [Alphaproteobacteria bacterium]
MRGARGLSGVLTVGDDGVHRFFARDLAEPFLRDLAGWVCRIAPAWDELHRLCGAQAYAVDGAGAVTARFDDPLLWPRALPRPAVGTLAHTLEEVQRLDVGDSAWLWATTRGPDGDPRPLVVRTTRGEDVFTRQVVRLHRDRGAQTTGGLLDYRLAGAVLELPRLGDRAVLDAVVRAHPRLEPLLPAFERHALAVVAPRLGELDGKAWFTFHHGRLQIAPTREELAPRGLRGTVHRAAAGHLVFRTKVDVSDLLEQLAAWVTQHLATHPEVLALVGARHRVVLPDGEEVRYRDDALWAHLPEAP